MIWPVMTVLETLRPKNSGYISDMEIIDQRVEQFLETWEKRKAGELPCPDLSVICASCGLKIIGDDEVQFTTKGLICKRCLNNDKSI